MARVCNASSSSASLYSSEFGKVCASIRPFDFCLTSSANLSAPLPLGVSRVTTWLNFTVSAAGPDAAGFASVFSAGAAPDAAGADVGAGAAGFCSARCGAQATRRSEIVLITMVTFPTIDAGTTKGRVIVLCLSDCAVQVRGQYLTGVIRQYSGVRNVVNEFSQAYRSNLLPGVLNDDPEMSACDSV